MASQTIWNERIWQVAGFAIGAVIGAGFSPNNFSEFPPPLGELGVVALIAVLFGGIGSRIATMAFNVAQGLFGGARELEETRTGAAVNLFALSEEERDRIAQAAAEEATDKSVSWPSLQHFIGVGLVDVAAVLTVGWAAGQVQGPPYEDPDAFVFALIDGMYAVVSAVVVVILAAVLVVDVAQRSIRTRREIQRLRRIGVAGDAEIVSVRRVQSWRRFGDMLVTYRFVAEGRRRHGHRQFTVDPGLRAGDRVVVRYDPADPDINALETSTR